MHAPQQRMAMAGMGQPAVGVPPHGQYVYDPPGTGYEMPPVAAGFGAPMPYGVAVPYMQGPPPVEAPPMDTADHPDLFVPKPVQDFLPRFRRHIQDHNLPEILNSYEVEFNRLSDRWFTEDPWPSVEQVATLDGGRMADDEIFLTLYKELYFRHIYAKHKPTIEHRFNSFSNYCDLFNFILNTEEPIDLILPNKWLWDIIDEFIYQFQSFVQFRGKLKSRTAEEILSLRENQKMWNIHSVLNVLYSLVAKSNINQQLEAFFAGQPLEPGEFGGHSLYKNLGYFSLIGLLRLHSQLGDYYQALQCVANVQLSKKVLAVTRVPAAQISLYYYVGFCYFMMRRYKHKTRTLVSTTKGVKHLSGELQSSSDLDFYIDGDMIHIADTKVARRYGDFFIRQISKLEEISGRGS